MASPVSLGDAILIAKLALRLGKAFTRGRKSAPSEFREVEAQLYSLSTALQALGDASQQNDSGARGEPSSTLTEPTTEQAKEREAIDPMLQSCQKCLEHLDEVVKKYSSIVEPRDSQQSRSKRWAHDIKTNWKKIQWTTEGGNLDTLRSQLTVHTNALNLVLTVAFRYEFLHLRSSIFNLLTLRLQLAS